MEDVAYMAPPELEAKHETKELLENVTSDESIPTQPPFPESVDPLFKTNPLNVTREPLVTSKSLVSP